MRSTGFQREGAQGEDQRRETKGLVTKGHAHSLPDSILPFEIAPNKSDYSADDISTSVRHTKTMKAPLLLLTLLATTWTPAQETDAKHQSTAVPLNPESLDLQETDGNHTYASTIHRTEVVKAGGEIPLRGEQRDEGVGLAVAVDRGTEAFAKLFPDWKKDWVLHQATRKTFPLLGRLYRIQFQRRIDLGNGPADEFKGISVYVLYDGTVVPITLAKTN